MQAPKVAPRIALGQSGMAGIVNSEANTTKEGVMSSDRMDLVVIGAGLAGMIAALRAADLGANRTNSSA